MCFSFICSIDATHSDGLGRLINDEEKRPNAVMKKIVTNTRVSLCVFALRNISPGDEIRYDYGPDDGKMYWRQTQQSCRFTPNQSVGVVECDTVKHAVVSPTREVLECDTMNLSAVTPAVEIVECDTVNLRAVVSPILEVLACDTANLSAVVTPAVEVVECDTVDLRAVVSPTLEVLACDTVGHVRSESCSGSIEAGAVAPFIKFEDLDKHFRPHFVQLKSAASTNLYGDLTSGIFKTLSTENSRTLTKPARKALAYRYCECCDTQYSDLNRHVHSFQHRMFVITKSNFAEVDKLINDINCGFSLKDVSGTTCEDDIRNLEISAKVVECDTASPTLEVLECDTPNLPAIVSPAVEVVECDTAKHTVVSLVDYSDTNSSVSECMVMQSVHLLFVYLARTIFTHVTCCVTQHVT